MPYFGCYLGYQVKPWTPNQIFSDFSNGLRDWLNIKKTSVPFVLSMIQMEQRDHYQDLFL